MLDRKAEKRWNTKADQGMNRKSRPTPSLRRMLRIKGEESPIPMRSVIKAYQRLKRKAQRQKGRGKKMSPRDRIFYRKAINYMISKLPRSKRKKIMNSGRKRSRPSRRRSPRRRASILRVASAWINGFASQ